MNKIIVFSFLFISQFIVAQKLTKEKLIEKFSENACKCITDKGITAETMDKNLGLCLIESISKYSKEVEKYYGKNIYTNDEKMTELAESVGANLAFTCPSFTSVISEMSDDEVKEAEEALFINGTITNTNFDQFLTFTLKEESGKTNTILVLEDFDNFFLISDSVLKPTDKVKVTYYTAELYDAKIKKFTSFKVVLDIIKE